MSFIFWLDVAALGLSAVTAAALMLMVLGSGLRSALNRAFVLFAATETVWALFSLLLRLALWLERGDPLLFSQLVALSFSLMGPWLLLFVVRYVERPTRRVDLAVAAGLVVIALLCVPLFAGQIVLDAWLESTGATTMEMSAWGFLAAWVPAVYMIWSLLLFWQERHQTREPYLSSSILVLLLGFVLGGLLNLPFPIVSITNTLAVITLGYGVVGRQLFNPLRARTIELQREVAERRRAESQKEAALEALQESERFMKNVFDAIQDGISVLDQDLNVVQTNKWMEEMYAGQSPLPGKKCYAAYQGRSSPCPWCPSLLTLESGRQHTEVVPYPSAEEPVGWIELTAFPFKDDDGQTVGVIEYVKDITPLRESEERHRALFEGFPDAIFLADPDSGEILGANPAASRLVSRPLNEIVGLHYSQLHPPDMREDIQEMFARRVHPPQGDEARPTLSAVLRSDGSQMPVEIRAQLVHVQGKPVLQGVFRDITERKRAEEEVLRLQHLLQNITDSMPSALITLDPAGQVLLWNPAAETLTGQTAEQMLGQSAWQTCPKMARYRELFEQVIREGQTARQHKDAQATNGGMVYHDVSVFPLAANDVEGAVLRVDDVTRRVQLEEMMLQSAKMASVGGLAAGVAHEINNPLGAMMQSAQVLQIALDVQRPQVCQRLERLGLDPEKLNDYLQERGLWKYLDGIRASGARAAKIVADLLSFSRKASSDVAPRDLNLLVEQALGLAATDYDLKKQYDFRNIEVSCEFGADLPQIICDGQQIQQVVLNLVRNAAQAMVEEIERGDRDREYQPRLVLRTSVSSGWVRLEVEDNGPGVSEGLRERLFEPFFTTKAVGEGTGLGLWLCWSIVVERHQGRIWVEPGGDGGARFVVELPLGR